jgi:hypothetical protein
MNPICIGTTLAIALSLPSSIAAQHPDSMRYSLRGVGEISVVVEFEPDGLARQRLRDDDRNPLLIMGRVERKLRRGGLAANPTVFDDKHVSGLIVQLDVRCSELVPVCAVGISARLSQYVRLLLSGSETVGVTWHAEQTSILPFDKMSEAFSGLDGILDRLVNDWQVANNKKAG